MQYFLDHDYIDIYPLFMHKLGKGKEGNVYSYKGDALKIYHLFPEKKCLNKEECEYLRKINTNRILLPKEILLDLNDDICGYTTEKISKEKDIYKINKIKLIEELDELKKEIKELSSKYVILGDWINENFKYDGMMKFVDPGDYSVDFYKIYGDREFDEIIDDNNEMLDSFVINSLFGDYIIKSSKDNYISHNSIYGLKSEFNESNYKCIDQFLEKDMNNNMLLEEYIKTKIR